MICPLLSDSKHNITCKEHECKFWIMLVGTNKNSGKPVNDFDCAISWLPMLLVEGANESRKTSQSVQGFRNSILGGIERLVTTATLSKPAKTVQLINGGSDGSSSDYK